MANLVQLTLEAISHAQAGRMKEAEQRFQLLSQLSPLPTGPILLASMLPPIYHSMEDLRYWRQRLEDNVRKLVNQGLKSNLSENIAVPEFFAQYHGLNDRQLQETRTRLYIAPQHPNWGRKRQRSAGEKIRVGLISKYFRDHTIGRLSQGLVAKLPREDFHITVLSGGPPKDEIAEAFRRDADQYLVMPPSLAQARELIAGLKLDILYYTDLGMDPFTYTLALSRLAPVQCVTWGHPVTSGMSTVDYFISAEGLEPEESQDQYTERLVKLKDLAVYYYRPTLSGPPMGAAEFGLPTDMHIYGCPQSLYKFHPEFDAMLAGILRGDPKGLLVLLAPQYKEWEQTLLTRLSRSMPEAMDRVRFIPRLKREAFLQFNAACDVLLDPPHFGGGNTIYEALALGTPVVTWPSGMLRGRLAYKMYLTMGMTQCVAKDAADYVQIAVRLGTNKEYREVVKKEIREKSSVLFENNAGVNQLAEFWKSAAAMP
jgi:predicted O-linked N-acetylglucosamine transferase (SPINDLY family)